MKDEFKVKFRGVRGSYPVPGSKTVKYGGNTTCIELRINGHLIIIDAGTGIISLGQEMMGTYMSQDEQIRSLNPMTATLLFTHAHLDHVQGFPFFVPVYIGSSRLFIYGPRYYDRPFRDSLASCMHSPLFPVEFDNLPFYKEVNSLKGNELLLFRNGEHKPEVHNVFRIEGETPDDAVKVYTHESYAHPCNGVIVYKFVYKSKTFVFATDVEGYKGSDSRLVKFAQGADVLVHDAQYTNDEYKMSQGFGHSTIDMATDVARDAKVGQLILFHHDPRHDDQKLDDLLAYASERFPQTLMARENAEIDLFNLKTGQKTEKKAKETV